MLLFNTLTFSLTAKLPIPESQRGSSHHRAGRFWNLLSHSLSSLLSPRLVLFSLPRPGAGRGRGISPVTLSAIAARLRQKRRVTAAGAACAQNVRNQRRPREGDFGRVIGDVPASRLAADDAGTAPPTASRRPDETRPTPDAARMAV